MNSDSPPRLPPELLQACHDVNPWRHLWRLGSFSGLYLLGAGGAIVGATRVDAIWQWAMVVPFYMLAAASLHGISLLTHEAVHGTLGRRRWWNDGLGAACALPVLQNCAAYRVLHLRHHRHLGGEADPDHYASYTRWTWMIFLMNWLRLLIGYPVYVLMIPILGFKHGTAGDRVRIAGEVAALAVVVGAVWISPIPGSWLWHGWLIPMVFINTMVNIRGMSQHTLLEHSDDEVRGTRTILCGAVVRFFMCNENFHLEHHLYPGVPWYRLPQVHEALRADLIVQGAPYISSYTAFVREFIRHSFRRSPLGWRRGTSNS